MKQVQNAYVIITSREEVFKEFEIGKLSQADLEEFERRLSIMKPSYDYERRVEILQKWAKKEGCKWLRNKHLTQLICLGMQDETVLPTPLSIRDFVLSTVTIDSEHELTKMMLEKSTETALVFAREISEMSDDRVLFLSYAFISGFYDLRNLGEAYKKSARHLKIGDPMNFEKLLDWFKDDKVTLGRKMQRGRLISFSHPSYSEAFGHLVRGDERVQRTITLAIQELVRKGENRDNLARVIAFQFDKLVKSIRGSLFSELIADEEGAKAMATVVLAEYEELPNGKQMLLTLASDADYALEEVLKSFVVSPFGYPIRILSQLAEDENGMFVLSNIISTYFDEMPTKLRDSLVLKMADDTRARNYIVDIIDSRFDHARLIRQLRNEMIRLPTSANYFEAMEKAIDMLFDELPSSDKNVLILAFGKMRRALVAKRALQPSHREQRSKHEWN